MILSDTSEARVRGYLYVLERSLHASLPAAVVADAVREVEWRVRDRVAESQPLPDERAALERIFEALGAPTRVAGGYSLELSVNEALVTGRFTSTLRVIWLMASTTLAGFVAALFLMTGYVAGLAFLLVGAMTLALPNRFGMVLGSDSVSFGPYSPAAGGLFTAGGASWCSASHSGSRFSF